MIYWSEWPRIKVAGCAFIAPSLIFPYLDIWTSCYNNLFCLLNIVYNHSLLRDWNINRSKLVQAVILNWNWLKLLRFCTHLCVKSNWKMWQNYILYYYTVKIGSTFSYFRGSKLKIFLGVASPQPPLGGGGLHLAVVKLNQSEIHSAVLDFNTRLRAKTFSWCERWNVSFNNITAELNSKHLSRKRLCRRLWINCWEFREMFQTRINIFKQTVWLY